MNDTILRFQAAKFLGMKLIGVYGGIPMFNGTPDQFAKFHRYLNTLKV